MQATVLCSHLTSLLTHLLFPNKEGNTGFSTSRCPRIYRRRDIHLSSLTTFNLRADHCYTAPYRPQDLGQRHGSLDLMLLGIQAPLLGTAVEMYILFV